MRLQESVLERRRELAARVIARSGRAKLPTWTTKDGRVLVIKYMSDIHLMNALKMVERNTWRRNESYFNAVDASEMANVHFATQDDLNGDQVYQDLLKEAKSRKLLT
jgi:hypothetical protein